MSVPRRIPLLLALLPGLVALPASCHDRGAECRGLDAVLLQTTGRLQRLAGDAGSARSTMSAEDDGEKCNFMVEPMTAYFWDPTCKNGGLGCNADGLHPECRFCGDAPETTVACPSDATLPKYGICRFEPDQREPVAPFYWDSECEEGMLGCKADGRHVECRFCGGEGDYKDIPCPACRFAAPPSTPHYWDNACKNGGLGCNADGIHPECRFCAQPPFESVPCPESVLPSNGTCFFPNEPKVSYYWDADCKMGIKGCNADGIHVHCRFCGSGAYDDVACP